MISANIPQNEKERLKNLHKYKVLDSLPEEEYDAITKIASTICNTPIALVSLVDEERQWFKSKVGLDAEETPRDYAFCAHAILEPDEIFEVENAKEDERFVDNPLTVNDPNIIFYAGAPLNTSEGFSLGALCVIDNQPKKLNKDQKEALKLLAKQVVKLLELRNNNAKLTKANTKIKKLNENLNDFAYKLSHDLKSPLNNISFLIDVLKTDYSNVFENDTVKDYFNMISNRISYMENFVSDMLNHTKMTNMKIVHESFNLKELVDNIIKNIDVENKIEINSEDLDTTIFSSKISFLQIFQNLISNSKKYTDEEKVIITIDFFETKSMYNFIYKDNGPGIPKKYWKKVFGMLETLSNTNDNTGIGLATVKSTIERLGGSIYLSDRPDNEKGVCFNFSIQKKEKK